jgi:hypothetical protein
MLRRSAAIGVSTDHPSTGAGPVWEFAAMTHVYFHCSNAGQIVLDPRGVEVEDLVEAHERATQMVRAFVASIGPDDWRAWTLHVSDEDGEDLFLMPFACVVGRPH